MVVGRSHLGRICIDLSLKLFLGGLLVQLLDAILDGTRGSVFRVRPLLDPLLTMCSRKESKVQMLCSRVAGSQAQRRSRDS